MKRKHRSKGRRRSRPSKRQTKASNSVHSRKKLKLRKRSQGQRKSIRKPTRLTTRQRKTTRAKRRLRSRRRMLTFSNGQRHLVVLSHRMAGTNGRYLNAVRRLLHTNDASGLDEFAGQSIKDVSGNKFPFETRPNALYRLNAVPEPIAEIYQVLT